jgi:transposase-like protein
VVVLNPARVRERYKCRSCNHHICDDCAARAVQGEPCLPYKVKVEAFREQAARQAESPSILLP